MTDPDVPDVLGWARKSRGIIEGGQWAESLAGVGISTKDWDERFSFAQHNISVQPLLNTFAFLDHHRRLIQVWLPNEFVGDVFFRIEPDDDNCTLLWIAGRRFNRIG